MTRVRAVFKRSASKEAGGPRTSRGGRILATGFEEGSGVKGGTGYMATYATGVLPGREGLMSRTGSRRRRACMPAGLVGRRVELESGLRMVQEGGEA